MDRKHSHYFKPVAGLQSIDVYRVLQLFAVTDPCLQHAIKKLLVAGGRGGGKDISRDVQEAIDTLQRWQEMRTEETRAEGVRPSAEETVNVRPCGCDVVPGVGFCPGGMAFPPPGVKCMAFSRTPRPNS